MTFNGHGLAVIRRTRRPRRRHESAAEEQGIVASYQLGTNSFVRKPIEFHEFQQVMKEIGVYWLLVNQPPL